MPTPNEKRETFRPKSASPELWLCRPLPLVSPRYIVAVCLAGIPLGIVLARVLRNPGNLLHYPLLIVLAAVVIVLLILLVKQSLKQGWDCLYLDEHGFMRMRRTQSQIDEIWAVPFEHVRDVSFRGGTIGQVTLYALIAGGNMVHTRDVEGLKTQQFTERIGFDFEALRLHPELFEKLIELAKPHAEPPRRKRALTRARTALTVTKSKAPPPLPLEQIAS